MTRVAIAAAVGLLVGSGLTGLHGQAPAQAARHLDAAAAKKQCHTVTKKVHGKKTKVKVCKRVKPKPTPIPTPTVPPNAFGYLGDIATDAEGNVYVTDWMKCRVEKLSPTGHLLLTFGSFTDCTVTDAPHGPYGIALDAHDNVWVSDAGTGKVTEFSPTGQVVRTWGNPGIEPGDLTSITSIGISPKGEIAVADVANHAVQFFTPDGTYLRSVGRQGEEPGQFVNYLSTLVFDAQGNLYVADHTGAQVQIFSPDGKVLKVYGQGQLGSHVNGVALAPDGTLYVQAADVGIDKISPTGQISTLVPGIGGGGIAVDPSGHIWATDEDDNWPPNGHLDEFSPDGKLLQSLSQPVP